jgi:hypothetical protein
MRSALPTGAAWDDEWRIRRKLTELKLHGSNAERVRREYATQWYEAGSSASGQAEAMEKGRAAANGWLSALTLPRALAIK